MPKAARRMAAQRSFKRQQRTVERLYTQGAKLKTTPCRGLRAKANRFFRGNSFMHLSSPWRDGANDPAALHGDGTNGWRCNTTACSAPRKIYGSSNAHFNRMFLNARGSIRNS